MKRKPAPLSLPEFWHVPAVPVTADELEILQQLQAVGGFTTFPNVIRCALSHLTRHYGIRTEAETWQQR